MIHPGVVESPSVLLALYYFSYALGGPGFSVPMGLFIAGVSIPSAFMKLLPTWVIVAGDGSGRGGGIELAALVDPENAVSYSPGSVSGIHLVDRGRARTPEESRGLSRGLLKLTNAASR